MGHYQTDDFDDEVESEEEEEVFPKPSARASVNAHDVRLSQLLADNDTLLSRPSQPESVLEGDYVKWIEMACLKGRAHLQTWPYLV